MKKTFPIFMFLVFFALMTNRLCAQTQTTFTVIKVSGSVYSGALKRAVKNGDVLKTSDQLKFASKESYMHVINSLEGLKTVRHVPDNSPRELMQLLQTFLSPEKKNRSSRGAGFGMAEIKHQLNYDTLLILGEGFLPFNAEQKSMKAPSGIKASFTLNGKEVGRVISDESGLKLGKEFLFDSTTEAPYPMVQVIYFEDMNDAFFAPAEPLGRFVPLYTNEDLLFLELGAIITTLQASQLPVDEVDKEIITYLSTEYAKPVEQNLKDWLAIKKLMTH